MNVILDNIGWVGGILGGIVAFVEMVKWFSRRKSMKRYDFQFTAIGIAVIAAICGGLWFIRIRHPEPANSPAPPSKTGAEERMERFDKERHPNGLSGVPAGPGAAVAIAAMGFGPDDPKKPRVIAVLPFENLSNVRSNLVEQKVSSEEGAPATPKSVMVDPLAQSARLYVEEVLVRQANPQFRVVERRRIDQILLEKDFERVLGDDTKAAAFAGAQGATALVLGSIKSLDRSTREFEGYGIKIKRDVARIEINVRVIDTSSLEVIVSKPFEASLAIDDTPNLHQSMPDVANRLLKQCASLIQQDQAFLRDVMTRNPAETEGFVKLKVESSVEGSDVLVDGEFVGNAPAEIDARIGRPILVEVERAGYAKWSRRLTPRSDMVFKASLESKGPGDSEKREPVKKDEK
jgi:Curli production assembly/transport component CsgG/PEGA domain